MLSKNRPTTKIGVLLLPSFNALATMAFLDPFRAVNYLRGGNLYSWAVYALGQAPRASNGLVFGDVQSLAKAPDDFDLVLVSSSWATEKYRSKQIYRWLRRCVARGAMLGGIDTGALILAHAGLLNGYTATVHYEHLTALREMYPDTSASEALFVIDRDRFTCCGGHAASDLALELIRLQHGIDIANAGARYIFHDRLRSASEQQMPTRHEPIGYAVPRKLRQAIVLMERNVEVPTTLSQISANIGLSQRQMERLFLAHTGVPPVRYYLDVRLDRARGLVTQTAMSVLEVSVACGFTSPAYFTRVYKDRFGVAPLRDRVEGRIPFQFRSFPAHAMSMTRAPR